MRALRIVLFFVDGLGLGWNQPEKNPLAARSSGFWPGLLGAPLTRELGRVREESFSMVPVDATLGVPGFPQSATGQASLLGGFNAAGLMGRHHHGFPPGRLRERLQQGNLLLDFRRRGARVAFANMFTDEYFHRAGRGTARHSVTTETALAAGLQLRDREDLGAGRAVYQDIDHSTLRQRGYEVPERSPEEAGKVLAGLSRNYHLVLFEYFQTDLAGHSQDWERAVYTLDTFTGCLEALLGEVAGERVLVVLASDHGNVEDLSVKTHTCNPVPIIAWGPGHERLTPAITSLPELAPALLRLWEQEGGGQPLAGLPS